MSFLSDLLFGIRRYKKPKSGSYTRMYLCECGWGNRRIKKIKPGDFCPKCGRDKEETNMVIARPIITGWASGGDFGTDIIGGYETRPHNEKGKG